MTTRSEFFRDALLAAFGICAAIALLIVAGLWLTGAFSWLWFARIILGAALTVGLLEGLVLLRAMRAQRVLRNGYGLYGTDRTAGCTAAVLIAFVIVGLMVCGVVLEWVLEIR